MDSTPVYSLPFPEDTDAPDGPAQLEALALGVETELVRIDAAIAVPWARGAKARVILGTTADIGGTETIVFNVTFTAEADRCYKVTAMTPVLDNQGTGAQTGIVTLRYVAGAGPVTNAGTLIAKAVQNGPASTGSSTAGSAAQTVTLIGHINDPSAGSVNVGIGLTRSGTTDIRFLQAGTIGPDFQPYLLVEDIGPAF